MVSFVLTPEQEELAATARRFFQQHSAASAVRTAMADETGVDRNIWRRMGQELGFLGMAVPEEYGGAGGGFVELATLMEEAGRALVCAPLLGSTVLATNAVLLSNDDKAKAALLPGLATGEQIGAMALGGTSTWSPDNVRLSAIEEDGGWFLEGEEFHVIDGNVADLVLTAARTPVGECSLFAVRLPAAGAQRKALPTLDQTRPLCNLTFRHVPAQLVGPAGQGWSVVERVMQLGALGIAAEQLGGADRCFEIALEYLKLRQQFDRPIGSFQALKHRCADLAMELESARALVMYAARAAAGGAEDFPAAASMAKAHCSDTYFHAAAECIQMLGGIGFTWEHDAHLFFKRATADRLLLGSPEAHNELLLTMVGV